MKKLLLITVITFASFNFFTSCTCLKVTEVDTKDISGVDVIQKPVLVDLDVKDTKVTGTATGTISKITSLETVKALAISDAVKKVGADVLVNPTFETESCKSRVTATVTGYPANYKNFRPITPEDVPLLKVGTTQTAKVSGPTNTNLKPGHPGLIVGGTLGLVVLIVLIAVL